MPTANIAAIARRGRQPTASELIELIKDKDRAVELGTQYAEQAKEVSEALKLFRKERSEASKELNKREQALQRGQDKLASDKTEHAEAVKATNADLQRRTKAVERGEAKLTEREEAQKKAFEKQQGELDARSGDLDSFKAELDEFEEELKLKAGALEAQDKDLERREKAAAADEAKILKALGVAA